MLRRLREASSLVIALATLASACTRQDQRLEEHREKFESLGSSTAAIAEAWLAGSASGIYTSAALEQMFLLVEQERSALASAPDALLDPRGAELSQAGERLSRLIAAMTHDVRAADGASLRQHLTAIPIRPKGSR